MNRKKKALGFEINPTDSVVYSSFNPSIKKWNSLTARRCEDKNFWPSPFSSGLNYGLAVFEGMKAFRHKDGKIYIFRPHHHARRFIGSLKGLSMPPFPTEKFTEAVKRLVYINAKFVPEYRQGSLYIRPIAWGDKNLGFGHNPNLAYTAAFQCSPVGLYYTGDLKSIAVYIMREMTRAMPGGLGYCKVAGNYEISRMAKVIADKHGCGDALFLDGKTKTHIEEFGAANVFVVKNDALYTPPPSDTILSGITRKSIITLAKSVLRLKIYEQDIRVKDVTKMADEVFACGTAVAITPVGQIRDGKTIYTIGDGQTGQITKKLYDLLTGVQYGDIKDKFGWMEEVEK
ncbi:MAG: branched-chain amino acid aminotransferase [Candidatus Nealsonbacteria bacterium]|nr:branched-chain amino acid aminotransferase [Candidatus Nealsonbacteria bacterium]